MPGQLYYPKADRKTQRFDDDYPGLRWEGRAEKGCFHTTETSNWPSYSDGATAPNFTVKANFTLKRLEWRQHYPANMSARALQNDRGGVETNRDRVIQVEIVGTCDGRPKGQHAKWRAKGIEHLYTPELPDWAMEDLAEFVVWCEEEHGIPFVEPGLWLPYDDSYGNSRARMSGAKFNLYRGWLGHMHVAENDHGDPGAMDVARILEIARNISNPAPNPLEQDDDMKATDQVQIKSPSARKLLGQEDGVMEYQELLALQTAAAIAGNNLLADVLATQGRIEEKLDKVLNPEETNG